MVAAAIAVTMAWAISTPSSANAHKAAPPTPSAASDVTPPSIVKQVWGPQTPFTKDRLCDGTHADLPDHPPLPPAGDPAATPAAFSFDGQDNPDPSAKTDAADSSGAAGHNYYVQVVNFGFAIYSKTGASICHGSTADWWKDAQPTAPGQAPPLPACTGHLSDAVVLYDQLAGRWFESRLASNASSTGADQCVAVSMTDDPTGGWFLYAMPTTEVADNVNLAPCPNPNGAGSVGCASDYPKWGIWPNGYYLTANARPKLASGDLGDPVGVIMEAVDRHSMLAGRPANAVSFYIEHRDNEEWKMQPAGLDGQTQPPSDAPGLFVQVQASQIGFDLPPGEGRLVLWELQVPVTADGAWNSDISGSSFSESQAITPQPNFDPSPCPSVDNQCVEQPSGVGLNALAKGLPMYRTTFRRLADHDALLFNLTDGVPGPGPDGKVPGVRWIEFERSGDGAWSIRQQGDFAPGADTHVSHWLGSLANDHNGNIALGFSETAPGTDQHPPIDPSIGYVGRGVDDPSGSLRAPLILQQGHDSQVDDDNQFGDYSQMTIDPVDDCTFWYTNEYYKPDMGPEHLWSTRIGAFRFPACATPVAAAPVTVVPTFTG